MEMKPLTREQILNMAYTQQATALADAYADVIEENKMLRRCTSEAERLFCEASALALSYKRQVSFLQDTIVALTNEPSPALPYERTTTEGQG